MTATQATTTAEAPAPALAFSSVDPLECGEEIKELFLAHERPEFPAYFDRMYPDVVRDGARSLVGRDGAGRVCAHVAYFPRSFRLGQRVVRAALLGNLMVAKKHRTLFPAVTLLRELVNACRRSGVIDFVYGDPNDAAMVITRIVGLKTVGTLRRFVAPVSDRRAILNMGIGLYQFFRRFRVPMTDFEVRAQSAIELAAGPNVVDSAEPDSLVPAPRPAVYRHRLPGYPGVGDRWYTFHRRNASEPVAAVLVRAPDARALATVGALHCTSVSHLGAVLLGLTRVLRGSGIERLEVSLMGESRAADAALRAGFLARHERIPVVAMPLTALGAEALASGAEWRLLPVDLDR